jgi:hypothetical protein
MADGSVVFSTELDTSGLKSDLAGIEKNASAWSSGAGNALSKGFGKAANVFGTFTKVAGAAFAATGTALTGLITSSMSKLGELEQNLGGSEVVFAEYAQTVQTASKTAFRDLGLSQSDYLQTANKMGSLFKGAGFEMQEATDITTAAMQRAADVASIMGIDTAWAMESIAGAAKGNFTMMDNLGVAINDTTLANYALEKGIKKSTKKMTTQEKVALAMEMFMERTAYAAGNYAKENMTLAGALGTAKAALTDFMTGQGTVDDLAWALENAANVIGDNFTTLVPTLFRSIGQLAGKLAPVLNNLAATILPEFVPLIASTIGNLVGALFSAVKSVGPDILANIYASLTGDTENAEAIKTYLTGLFEGIESVFSNTASFINDVVSALTSLATWCEKYAPVVKGALFALFGALIAVNWPLGLVAAAIALVIANWDGLKAACKAAYDAILNFFSVTVPEAWFAMIAKIKEKWDEITAAIGNAILKFREYLGIETKGDPQNPNNPYGENYHNTGKTKEQVTSEDGSFWDWVGNVFGVGTANAGALPPEIAAMNDQAAEVFTQDYLNSLNEQFAAGEIDYATLMMKAGLSSPEGGAEAGTAEAGGEESGAAALAVQVMTELAAAMEANAGIVSNSLSNVLSDAQNAADVGSFVGVGTQIVAGIAAGVTSGSGILTSAIKRVIQQALQAAKDEAVIRSPSRLFKAEVGVQIPAGAAEGVKMGAFRLYNAVSDMITGSIPDSRGIASNIISGGSYGASQAVAAATPGVFNQTNNFNLPVETPDEFAQTMRIYNTYGLAAQG